MSIREPFPGDRGAEVIQDMASILDAIARLSIEPFGSDSPELAGLPERPSYPVPDPLPITQLFMAQCAYNSGLDVLGIFKTIESAVAGSKARWVARVSGAAAVEAQLLTLHPWQNGISSSSATTEIAMRLGIPEPTAAALEHHSTALVQERPDVLEALDAGGISWRHATIINDELHTLQETTSTTVEDAAALQAHLLKLSENTTAASFAGKARRARERMHPETITTRTKEAFTKRYLKCEPGKDGMSWLTLHLPTVSASAIFTRCTRLSRSIKADANAAQHAADMEGSGQDCREYRTLQQLRADVASILLLGQDLPTHDFGGNDGVTDSGTAERGSAEPHGPGGPDGNDSGGKNDSQGHTQHQSQQSGEAGHASREHTSSEAGTGTTPTSGNVAEDPTRTNEFEKSPHGALDDRPIAATAHGSGPTDNGRATAGLTSPDPVQRDGTALLRTEKLAELVGSLDPQWRGDGSGLVGWIVDGISEDPEGEYLQQLNDLAQSKTMADPPMPEALIMVTVPFLGLLGLTDEPAELVGRDGGPVPEVVAQKLLKNSNSFLRILTDPITGETLPLEPQRYTLRAAEKAVLQALTGGCYVPNCPNPVMDTELDHLRAFEFGGPSTWANLRGACKRHHLMKHFKDDKDRNGRRRSIDEPERNQLKLRGWTPQLTEGGRVGWIMPSGKYQAPQNRDRQRPQYPKWLKKLINRSIKGTKETRE